MNRSGGTSAPDFLVGGVERLRQVADALPALISYVSADHRYRFNNRAYRDWFGLVPGEIAGRHLREVMGEEGYAAVKDNIDRVLAGERLSTEMVIPYKSGGERHVHVDYVPDVDGTGRVAGYFALIQDIDERRRVEEALRESEARFRRIADSAPTPMWVTRLDRKRDFVNRAYVDFLGISREQAVDFDWRTIIHPDDHDRIVAESVAGEASLKAFELEGRYRRKDGEWRWLRSTSQPRFDADGQPNGFIGVAHDITDAKRSEEALREETRALETLNATGAALAAELDQDRLVQMVTDAGVDLTGAAFGAFFYNVVNEDGESYMLYALSGAERSAFEKFPMPRNTAIFGPTFRGEGIVRSDDITRDPRYGKNKPRKGMPEGHLPVKSYLAVPVVGRSGEVIGGLFFGHPEPGRFIDRHERLMTGIAAQAAIGIDNARLYQAAQREIAERARAENTLKESEAHLAAMVNQTTAGLGEVDLEGRFVSVNDRYCEIVGRSREELLDLKMQDITHPDDLPGNLRKFHRLVETAAPYEIEKRYIRPDGSLVWVNNSVSYIRAAADRPGTVLAVTIDITDRRKTEEALRDLNETLEARITEAVAEREQMQEALRQSQKMEAVGQLTGGIAHDFNNLLTVVIGNIDMGRRTLDTAGGEVRMRRALDNALRGAERAAALTQRLLAFSRRQPLSPKAIDTNKLVMGMSDLLGRALGETVELEVVTSPGLWKTEADPNELEAAILNLAVNARDAMLKGGKLTIETANASIGEAYSAVHAEVEPGSYVVISVTDTGNGMSKEMAARAFEPFFTTKEVGKGTGLGLSQVYGFVKQSGGHVNIYSEEGEGTTVKIYLPRLMGDGPEEDEESNGPALEPGRREECLLVVEDDDDVRGYTVELLREIGYKVLEAHDGPSALRLLERQEAPIELLFTDVVMPGMSGRELAERARALQPDLRILYTSGYTRNAIVHGGRLDPGVDLIVKPFTYQALARKVRDMLDTGRSGRLLVVQGEVAPATAAALEEGGYLVDATPDSGEALSRIRASGGHYDAVFIDLESMGKAGRGLATEVRALHRDLPLLLRADKDEAGLRAEFATDRCIAVIGEADEGALLAALERLGVRCAARRRFSRE